MPVDTEDDDLATRQQKALGMQSAEPAGPHPGFWGGLAHFGESTNPDASGFDIGPATPLARGIDQGLLYTASGLATQSRAVGESARASQLAEYGLPDQPADTRTDKEKEMPWQAAAKEMARSMNPDPYTAGAASQFVQGLTKVVTEAAAGSALAGPAGAMVTLGGATHDEAKQRYLDEGVDEKTAERLAKTEGLFMSALGALGPAGGAIAARAGVTGAGKLLLTEAATSMAGNTGLGIAQRYMDHQTLADAGYKDLAEQQQAWDGQAMVMDAAMGALPLVIPGVKGSYNIAARVARRGMEAFRNRGLARDAADVVNQMRGISRLAPGVPVDSQSAAFNNIALNTATEQNLAGEPVDLSKAPLPESGTFAVRPRNDREAMIQVVAQHLQKAGINQELSGLDADTRALFERTTGVKLPEPMPEPEPVPAPRSVEGLRGKLFRYASGMSRTGDLQAGGRATAGTGKLGVGVDVGELSKKGEDDLAHAVAQQGADAFIDSGAFSLFKRGLKKVGAVKQLDFKAILEKYDRISDKIGESDAAEEGKGSVRMVMPDIVGDQAASLKLIDEHKTWIKGATLSKHTRPIIPIQKGELSLADAYKHIVKTLGTDNFTVGIPSSQEAVSTQELRDFLAEAKPKSVHFLGAISDKNLTPKLEAMIEAGHSPNEISADGNLLRSALYGKAPEGMTRKGAIEKTLLERAQSYGSEVAAQAIEDQRVVAERGAARQQNALDRAVDGPAPEPGERPAAPPGEPRNPIDANASPAEQLEQLKALTTENKPIIDKVVEDLKEALPGTISKSNVKKDDSALDKVSRPMVLARKPWFGIDYLRDHLRFKTMVDNMGQLSTIPEVFAKHGIKVLKIDTEKMLDPSDWGWRMAALDLQMPNGQMVEHYATYREMNDAQDRLGHQLYEDGRSLDDDVPEERAKIFALKKRSRQLYEEAWSSALKRSGESINDVRADIESFRASAGSLTAEASKSVNVPRGILPDQLPPGGRTAPKPSAPSTESVPSGSFSTESGSGLRDTGTPLSTGNSIAPGAVSRVATATGRTIEVKAKVVEAKDLITSDHPDFPAQLQPRQRGARQELTEQVNTIARNLSPERLGPSSEADRGAPIVSPDNMVESGNGRVMALRQVYEGDPAKAEEYRAYLESQGYDTSKFQHPVLVRERQTSMEMGERRAFTVESNQSAIAALSPVERAAADASHLDEGTLSLLKSADLGAEQNVPFASSFLAKLPQSERNELVDHEGRLNQAGIRRLQGAILGKAYGGNPASNATLGRLLESTDTDMRSTMGALMDAAPAFARLRQAIDEGKVAPTYDISKAMTEAVEEVGKLRAKGQNLNEYLKQADFLYQRAPLVDQLMRAMYDRAGLRVASREKVAEKLAKYANQAIRQRLDQADIFGVQTPPEDLLRPPPGQEPPPEPRPSADMFGLRTPQGKLPGGAAAEAEPTRAEASDPNHTDLVAQAIDARPDMKIPDAAGNMVDAAGAVTESAALEEQAKQEAETAFKAATDCAKRTA